MSAFVLGAGNLRIVASTAKKNAHRLDSHCSSKDRSVIEEV